MSIRIGGDNGIPVVISHPDSVSAQSLKAIAQGIAAKVSVAALT
jgi:ATP-binding protein involved in chromosome partitioning